MEEPFVIDVSLHSLTQLFEAPGPLQSEPRALHRQVCDAIVDQTACAPRGRPLQLILRAPNATLGETSDIRKALREYFAFRCEVECRNVRKILQAGRAALFIGMGVLVVATAIGELIQETFQRRLLTSVAGGLEIFGWVALWHPAELLLYEWVPVYRRVRLMSRLAEATVECRPM